MRVPGREIRDEDSRFEVQGLRKKIEQYVEGLIEPPLNH
jgi:hypothetical protein